MNEFYLLVMLTAVFGAVLLVGSMFKMKKRVEMNPFLQIAVVAMVIFLILYFLVGYLYYYEYDIATPLERLGLLPIAVIFFCGYLFYEAMISEKPPL